MIALFVLLWWLSGTVICLTCCAIGAGGWRQLIYADLIVSPIFGLLMGPFSLLFLFFAVADRYGRKRIFKD